MKLYLELSGICGMASEKRKKKWFHLRRVCNAEALIINK